MVNVYKYTIQAQSTWFSHMLLATVLSNVLKMVLKNNGLKILTVAFIVY